MVCLVGLWAVLSPVALAQQTAKVTLDSSEALFSVLTAINACGYDQGLKDSAPVRAEVRSEVARAVQGSPAAAEAREQMCRFYRDHQQPDGARELAQYVSLALNLGEPPAFAPTLKESDLPPDASYVLGLLPLLQRFYEQAGLHAIWLTHQPQYEALIEQLHRPVANMILMTEVYLKLPSSGYLGRRLTVYVEPMAAPGQVNARNYVADYFVVAAPENGALRMNDIRHAYLHYVLDPMALKRANVMKRLEPLLEAVKQAPMEDAFKHDMALLVTESLIRAIEARTLQSGKAGETERRQMVEADVDEGFVLTRYFYDALAQFEKSPLGLRDAYGDLLHDIDLGREKKRAQEVSFSRQAAPEVVRASKRRPARLLDLAEDRLVSGDASAAQKLAQEALQKPDEDQARALFILARAATLNQDMHGARTYFERTLEVAREARMLAWSHIYLGRIFDLQANREAALIHYRAALAAGDNTTETKAAAERGLQQAYAPPVSRPETQQEKKE